MGCCSGQFRNSLDGLADRVIAGKVNGDLVDTIKFLRGTPTFSVLPPRDYPLLAAACTKAVYRRGEVIDVGDGSTAAFFVVKRGEASVWMDRPFLSPTGSREPTGSLRPPLLSPGSRNFSLPERRSIRTSLRSSVTGDISFQGSLGFRGSVCSSDASAALSPAFSPEPRRSRRISTQSGHTLPSNDNAARVMKVATLRAQDYFGEYALMGGENWYSSIIVESQEMEVIKITKDDFDKLKLSSSLRFPKRERVYLDTSAAQSGSNRRESLKYKDDAAREWIRNCLLSRAALDGFFQHNAGILEKLVDVAWVRDLPANQVLIDSSTNPGPCMYLVQEGSLHATHRQQKQELGPADHSLRRTSFFSLDLEDVLIQNLDTDQISTSSYSTIGQGSCYGELTLMYDTAHVKQVKTLEKTRIWVISQADLLEATRMEHNEKMRHYIECLGKVPIFSSLLSDEKMTIAKTLVEQTWTCGQDFYRQGEINRSFTILLHGEVCVIRDGVEEKRILVDESNPNKCPIRHFGERMLTENTAAPTTVRVCSTKATTLALAGEVFEVLAVSNLIQPLNSDSNNTLAKGAHYSSQGSSGLRLPPEARMSVNTFGTSSGHLQAHWTQKMSTVRKDSLQRLALLGRGGFGRVDLCEHKQTKEYYALKTVRKSTVAKTEFLKTQILNEKYILEMTGSRFIIKLFATDKNDQELFFILEAALGGELFAIYRSKKLFGSEVHAKYYSASVICAFEHLHERYILYRDLKPENLMLDQHGNLKLTDMGLAKFVVGRTFTVCGTPVYFAPEVAKQGGYNYAVDWWQLGILVWEFLTGRTPFPANSRGEAFYWLFQENVLMMLDTPEFRWPAKIHGEAQGFLKALLQYNPSMRVPMMPNGLQHLRENPWYEDLNWQELKNGKLQAPYQPPKWNPQTDATPNSNFHVAEMRVKQDQEYVDDGTNWDADF